MTTRTAVVLAALAVMAVHFLDEIWLHSDGDAVGARLGGTVLALSLTGLAALVWARLPVMRAAFVVAGLVTVSGAWSGLVGADAGGIGITGLPYLAAANALLAVGIVELAGRFGSRTQPHAAGAS
jgi:hypothetical protein